EQPSKQLNAARERSGCRLVDRRPGRRLLQNPCSLHETRVDVRSKLQKADECLLFRLLVEHCARSGNMNAVALFEIMYAFAERFKYESGVIWTERVVEERTPAHGVFLIPLGAILQHLRAHLPVNVAEIAQDHVEAFMPLTK